MALSLDEAQGELIKMLCPILFFALFKKNHTDRVKKKLKKKKYSLELKIITTLDTVEFEVP